MVRDDEDTDLEKNNHEFVIDFGISLRKKISFKVNYHVN